MDEENFNAGDPKRLKAINDAKDKFYDENGRLPTREEVVGMIRQIKKQLANPPQPEDDLLEP